MPFSLSRAAGAAVLASLLVTALAGCGANATPSAGTTGPKSITLTEGVQVQPNWWFPNSPGQYCSTENAMFTDMAYRPLLWISNSDAIDYSQSIASGITVSHNNTQFTVHLKKSWKWSNGAPVTAQDALFDAELLLHTSQSNAVWTQCGAGIGGWPGDIRQMTAPNSTTLVVTTTAPVNTQWFEENGLAQIYPVPITVWQHSTNWKTEENWLLKVGQQSSAPEFKVIDGPYGYGAFQNNAYSTLVANPKYSGPNPAHIQKITMLYETSESNLWAAALRGTFAEVGIPSQYNKSRQQLVHHGYKLTYAQYGFCFNYASPNVTSYDPEGKLLAQKYIRQALEMALDQKGMISLADNIGFPVYGPVPPTPKTVYYDPNITKAAIKYNPSAGRGLLTAHGWRMKNGVMTNAQGQTLTFTLLYATGSQWVSNAVQLWKQDLTKEGIVLNLKSEPFNQVIDTAFTPKSNWQIAWWGGGWCYEPDYMPTGDGLFTPGGSANSGGFNDPTLNRLIAATLKPASAAVEKARMDAYQVYAARDLPEFWMPETGGYNATQPWLHTPKAAWNPVQAITQFNLWATTAK